MPELKPSRPHRDPRTPVDVVVVGAGPVGQACARELTARGLRVTIVEAGGAFPRNADNAGVQAEVVGDDRWGELAWKTWRVLGGTSWAWQIDRRGAPAGVRHAGLEHAVVLRRTPGLRRWPLDVPALERLQARALVAVGLAGTCSADLDLQEGPLPGLSRGRYAFGSALPFRDPDGLPGAELLLRTRVVRLQPDAARPSGRLSGVVVLGPDGQQRVLPAAAVVLAASAVENARLVLELREQGGLPEGTDVGVGLMDRPRLSGRLELSAAPEDDLRAALARCALGGASPHGLVMERWCAPTAAVQDGLPSVGVVLRPAPAVGCARALLDRLVRLLLVQLPQKVQQRAPRPAGRAVSALLGASYAARSRVLRSVQGGWDLEWSDWGHRPWHRCRSWVATASVEQLPHPDNRVELGTGTDADGTRTARLVWGHPAQPSDVTASLELLSQAVARSGAGRLEWAGNGFDAVSSHHLSGTLAMGDDASAAAEPSGRVRGSDNLWAAGACLFPTSGHANPTLQAVALGLHAADGVVEQLTGTSASAVPGQGAAAGGGPDAQAR